MYSMAAEIFIEMREEEEEGGKKRIRHTSILSCARSHTEFRQQTNIDLFCVAFRIAFCISFEATLQHTNRKSEKKGVSETESDVFAMEFVRASANFSFSKSQKWYITMHDRYVVRKRMCASAPIATQIVNFVLCNLFLLLLVATMAAAEPFV